MIVQVLEECCVRKKVTLASFLFQQEVAISLINNGSNAQKFVQDLENNTKAGDKYSCGYTR